MARVKRGVNAKKRHNKIFKLAKGYYGSKSTLFRTANQAVNTPGQFQGITQNVGVADNGIVLVVMGENAESVSQSGPDAGEFVFHVRS